LHVRRNPDVPTAALWLDGEALQLASVAVDGLALAPSAYTLSNKGLSIPLTGDTAHLTTIVRVEPDQNTALSGLYRSKDGYFTQCEAEGFRRITYFLDRPDVMARYTRARCAADTARYPVLLSNGNLVGAAASCRRRPPLRDAGTTPSPSRATCSRCVAGRPRCAREQRFVTAQRPRTCAAGLRASRGNLDKTRARHGTRSWPRMALGRGGASAWSWTSTAS
jgi:aminopeptidase N